MFMMPQGSCSRGDTTSTVSESRVSINSGEIKNSADGPSSKEGSEDIHETTSWCEQE